MAGKKEYGRVYAGLWYVKRRGRNKQRDRMIEGTRKMEADAEDGCQYSAGIPLQEEENEAEGGEGGPAKKRARTTTTQYKPSRTSRDKCKCGGSNHMRTSSFKCPWYGQSKEVVAQNYEQGMRTSALPQNLNPRGDIAVGNVPGNQNTGPVAFQQVIL